MLDVSRIISGKIRVESRPVYLREIAASAGEVIRPTAFAKRITLMTDLPVDIDLVEGDADRLQQVIWNLLSNRQVHAEERLGTHGRPCSSRRRRFRRRHLTRVPAAYFRPVLTSGQQHDAPAAGWVLGLAIV